MNTSQLKRLAALLCTIPTFASASSDNVLDEIVVTATRIAQPLNQSLSSTSVITLQDIQNSQAADVPTMLKNLAGVEIYQSGGIGQQSSLFLRGTNSSHVLILLDGARINSATTGTTEIDQLMLDQVERIEIVRGNVSSLYGSEAIGGVIQIFTKHGNGEPAFNISGSIGSFNTQRLTAGFGGKTGSTAFNAQVSRYTTSGTSAIKPSIVQTVNPDQDGYNNTSISANVNHKFNADHSLTISLFNSSGEAKTDNSFGLSTDVNRSQSHIQKFSLVSDNRFSAYWQSKIHLAQGMDDMQNFLNGVPDIALGSLFKTINNQITWQNTLQLGTNNVLNLGLENLVQKVASSMAYSRNQRTANSLFAGYTGNYGLHQVQLNLRQDRYSDFGIANTSLLGYGYAANETWRASASLSTAFKAPTINDLFYPFTSYGGGFSYQGNSNLKPERSNNLELGVHYAAEGQRMDAVYFDNHIRDLIVNDNKIAGSVINLNEARSDGFEIVYAGQLGDTGVKAALTQQNPRDTTTGLALLRRAKLFGNLGVTQKMGVCQMGAEIQHSGPREDIDINTFVRTNLNSYNVVNLTANYILDKRLNLSLRADNLFNRDYMLAHGYNTLGRTLFVGMSYRQ
jgi:vitamin B12 transporter